MGRIIFGIQAIVLVIVIVILIVLIVRRIDIKKKENFDKRDN